MEASNRVHTFKTNSFVVDCKRDWTVVLNKQKVQEVISLCMNFFLLYVLKQR